MTIDYEMTRQDYINFNMLHMKRSKSARKSINTQRFLAPIIFILIPFVISWGNSGDIPMWYWFTIFGIAAVCWALFYPKWVQRETIKRINKMLDEGENKGLSGFQKLSLTEEGIHTENEFKEATAKWNSVEDIVLTDEYILIYIGALMAHVVPLRAFNDDDEKEEFISILKERTHQTT